MSRLTVTSAILAKTLDTLRAAGRDRRECVVLWLARRDGEEVLRVEDVHVPAQEASEDFFHIPRESVRNLLRALGPRGQLVAAQVHSHPHEAFHSAADDRWAIVRHIGAVSIVLPHFAMRTDVGAFVNDAAIYVLGADNEWHAVGGADRDLVIEAVL